MSFLGDIVNSIGSGKAPTPPKPPIKPLSANSLQPPTNDSKPSVRAAAVPSPLNGVKRKADNDSVRAPEKHVRPNPAPGLTSSIGRRPAAPPLNAPKPSHDKPVLAVNRPKIDTSLNPSVGGSTTPTTPTTSTVKPPPAKGSFADIMARAKLAQESKAQNNKVGVIRHQASNREKHSKIAERKRQEEEKAKAAKEKPNGRTGKERIRSVSPTKKDQPRAPKVARPPLHAPATAYKGTMGIPASKSRDLQSRKKSRYDEYLGTDEEEESEEDGYGDEGDDYGSDVSSDMEVGAFELDEEENRTLRAAKEDDARELALEQRLKREKEERRKRLMSLASKNKSK